MPVSQGPLGCVTVDEGLVKLTVKCVICLPGKHLWRVKAHIYYEPSDKVWRIRPSPDAELFMSQT